MSWQMLALATGLAAQLVAHVARAEPTSRECVDASDRAIALQNGGELKEARSTLSVCSSSACPAEIRQDCARRIEEINAAIPTIVFDVKDVRGNDLTECHVTMDGRSWLERLNGSALPVDPGAHEFAFEAPGSPLVLKRFVLRQGEKNRREPIRLGAMSQQSDAAPGAGVVSASVAARPSGRILAGTFVAALGVTSLAVGATILGFAAAMDDRARQEDRLAPGFGHSDHIASTNDSIAGSIVAGAGLVAVGAALYLAMRGAGSTPASPGSATVAGRRPPALAVNGLGLVVKGSF